MIVMKENIKLEEEVKVYHMEFRVEDPVHKQVQCTVIVIVLVFVIVIVYCYCYCYCYCALLLLLLLLLSPRWVLLPCTPT